MLLNKTGTLIAYPSASGAVTLPSTITAIGIEAFYRCTQLATVELPAAETIGDSAFSGCTKLDTVELPEAKTIGVEAFIGCTQLATVSLPKATNIGEWAFFGTGDTTLTVTLGSTVPTLRDSIFAYVFDAKTVTVKVPSGAEEWNDITGKTYNETSNYTVNWGNGFRGGGWTEAEGFAENGAYLINSKISLTVETY
jgi:hypothetical protein